MCEALEKITEAFQKVAAVRKEIGQIVPVDRITFGSGRIKGGATAQRLEWYFNLGEYIRWGANYNAIDPAHIERAYNNVLKFVESAGKEIEVWHTENLVAIANNTKVAADIRSFMETVGVTATYREVEIIRKKRETVSKPAGYFGDITRSCVVDDGYEQAKNQLKSHLASMTAERDSYLKKITESKATKEKEDRQLRKIAKAMELYASLGLTEPYTTNDELIEMVNEPAQEAWVKDNYPNGDEMMIKCCDSCSTWTIGDHRCSCGNRRMYLSVDGDFFEGFTAYAEAL